MLKGSKKQLVTDYSLVFNSEHGKRVFADLRKKALLLDKSAKEVNPTLDVEALIYQEGQRSVLLYIFKMLNTDPYAERASHAVNNPKL